MSKRQHRIDRKIAPDPKYHNQAVAKFINYVMERGKKTTSQKIVYTAFDNISQKTKRDPVEIFDQALLNVSPNLEIRARRIGGANYQIPVEVREPRRTALAMKWIIEAARAGKGRPMAQKLAREIVEASQNEGKAVKKKQETHRMAEANRAFAHYAW